MKLNTLIPIFLLLLSTTLMAQTGKIRVTVYEDETGEPMIGATVAIEGTTQGNITDLDGKANIPNLEPGSYSIGVSFVSFEKQIIENVEVLAGEVTTLDVRLTTETVGLEEVVVTAETIKNNETALLTVQKKSASVLDAISSDMFKRNGDNDAAAAVQRVVGVTVESGKYVYIRGLGDRYSKTILNGSDLPGLDPNKNSVQMDLFPSNLIDNIIVYKTFSPDLMGDFSGGLINMATKDFPDRFTFQVSGSIGLNPQANLNDEFITYNGGNRDWLGFDDGFRNIPESIHPYTQQNFPSPTRIGLPGIDGMPITQTDIEQATESFSNREFTPNQEAQPLNHNLSVSTGNQIPFLGKQLGFITGLTYRRSFSHYGNGTVNRFENISSNQDNLYGDVLYTLNDTRSEDEVTVGGILNTSMKLNNNNKIGVNLMVNQGGNNMTRLLDGIRLDNTPDSTNLIQTRVLSFTERSLQNGQLRGEHVLPGVKNLKIDWFSTYTNSTLDQPDLRFLQNNIILNGSNKNYIISNQNRPGRYYRDLTETNWDSRVHFELPFDLANEKTAKLKFGGAYTVKEREFGEDRYEYNVSPVSYGGELDAIFLDENMGQSGQTYLDLFTQEPNNYTADQTISAGYIMVDLPIMQRLRVTTGVRYEQTDQNVLSQSGERGKIATKDLLPSINTTYEISDNTNFRGSYSRTLARPSFREFAPLVTFAFYGEFDQVGNPQLQRTLIDNFDLRWESYPKRGEYIGVSAFYKNFDNPIENTLNPNSGGTSQEYKFENVDKAMVAGVEVDLRKNLDFISPALTNYKFSVNASYIHSKVSLEEDELSFIRAFDPNASDTRQMYNQSPYVVNAAVNYENFEAGWSSDLTFNVFGPRLNLFNTSLPFVYDQPRPSVNFNIKKELENGLSIRFRANNLLNSANRQTMDYNGEEYIYNSFRAGVSYSVTLSFLIE